MRGGRNEQAVTQDEESSPSALETSIQAKASETANPIEEAQAETIARQLQAARRAAQVEKRDDRRAKKEKARSQQALVNKKQTSTTAALSTLHGSSTPAESSKRGAACEAAVAKSDDAMDVDPSPSLFVDQTERYPVAKVLPKWYIGIKDTNYAIKMIDKKRPPALTSLEALKNCIGRCEIESNRSKLKSLYEELRDHVHKAEIKVQADGPVLKRARILHPENGLPRVFKEDAKFPSDLKADSFHLYMRWLKEDFSQDILRGVVTVKGKDRNGDRLDSAYRSKHPASAKYYGEGGLVLGQWWPTQLCTVRDGAHGTPQGGIFGEKDKGAYSIVLSSGGYHDQDDGDVIEYSGTDGKDFMPTENTQHMILSATLGNDIRVIRSSQLQKGKSKYRPELGLRYDGLYKIKSYELVDKEKQRYRFRLERCLGQDPIRHKGNARRPTIFEVEEFERLRTKVW
ncbi:hypothetical protein EK21DRAFT_59783 [Setomelanomma holmii]|uniref:YDG domain-containing protein n=1 Tax=Setomelanomma holmii TaxID=210430 RepID=A0A9P4LQQ1_9PLEO|nr:hypothetical protein EK21DRAFT_59783 [Setomelanomma holmii]